MPLLRLFGSASLVVLLLSGCASKGSAPFRIEDPNRRYSHVGVSVLAPQAPDWHFVRQDAYMLMFAKEPSKPEARTRFASVTSRPMKEEFTSPRQFLEFARDFVHYGPDPVLYGLDPDWSPDPDRFRVLEEEYVLDDRFGAYCVKFHNKAEDHGAREGPPLTLESWGYWFLHPENPTVSVVVLYSRRSDSDAAPPDAVQEANRFLGNAKLRALKKY